MLRLENIKKDYDVASSQVHALKGISLAFRKSEFVSILGPSGCGKTTLLNIIGGLDKYSDGDLFIGGKSTKEFSNHDWDVYRNHRIGFIFQSYNLIPHQTILGNVELALTIGGVSKKERQERSKKALDKVGLANQYHKMPNQLSGGQCQRVAIARALVNEPEILLADEPTGALDTETSKQIMDLIQEISKEKLVIMVTHNPELAEKYSSRIIRLLDGEVIDDTNPFSVEEETKEIEELRKSAPEDLEIQLSKENAKMKLGTAIRLSAQNLHLKRKRTATVAFAGSIGIIGVSLVLAFSAGIRNYITSMQDDLLSGNPITVERKTYDAKMLMDSMSMDSFQQAELLKPKDGYINVNSVVEYVIKMSEKKSNMMVSNDITKDYIDYVMEMPKEYYNDITLNYGIDPTNNFYTDFSVSKGGKVENRSLSSIVANYKQVLKDVDYGDLSSYIDMFYDSVKQSPSNKDYMLSQYDVLKGRIATEADEIMVVVNNKTNLNDIVLGQLGYYSQDEFLNIAKKALNDPAYNEEIDKRQFAYDEIMNKEITYYGNDTVYTKIPTAEGNKFIHNYLNPGTFKDPYKMKIVGILRPKEMISYGCLQAGFYYTPKFTEKFRSENKASQIVQNLVDTNKGVYSTVPDDEGKTNPVGYAMQYRLKEDGEVKTQGMVVGRPSYFGLLSSMIGSSSSDILSNVRTLSMNNIGGGDLAIAIAIYPLNFDEKDLVVDYLNHWNSPEDITLSSGKVITRAERSDITHTDAVGLIIDMINKMIDIISYALITFTALSLVVSTVMIGIITYVSVVERIKEIGVIRSLGGRRRDVSNLFFAETVMIGSVSGVLGIGITYLISLIFNLSLKGIIGFNIAMLPWWQALIMLGISIVLTLISGIIPARSAAKKDPVIALRTE